MGRKTPPFKNHPEWTEARFWSFIRSALRKASTRWPPKYKAKNQSRRKYIGVDKRRKFEYRCAECKGWFKGTEVQEHHIVDVGTLKCYDDLAGFVERLFIGIDGYMVLCKECHDKKTRN